MINIIIKDYYISKGDFFELALIEQIDKIDKEFKINDIDIKDFANLRKMEIFRNMHKYTRKEAKARHLFIERVKYDVYTYLLYKRTIKEILELLNIYKKEAKTYKGDTALKEIEEIIKDGENKQFQKLKEEFRAKYESDRTIKLLGDLRK